MLTNNKSNCYKYNYVLSLCSVGHVNDKTGRPSNRTADGRRLTDHD